MTNPTPRVPAAPPQAEHGDRAGSSATTAATTAATPAASQRETTSQPGHASSQTASSSRTQSDEAALRARGTPGSFDQPTPREDLMPPRGKQHPHQTAEVPLGSGDVPDPPGKGGQAAQNSEEAAPYLNVNGVRSPSDEPVRGATRADEQTKTGVPADRKGDANR